MESEQHFLQHAETLAGKTLQEIANYCDVSIPTNLLYAKGWIGQLLEQYLEISTNSRPEPDLPQWGIEIKSIPVQGNMQPKESTYVCTVRLKQAGQINWKTSDIYKKLRRVLWIPIEANPTLPISRRYVGTPLLWEPNALEMKLLQRDWLEIMEFVQQGEITLLDGCIGEVLQVRPKAKDSSTYTLAIDEDGALQTTGNRGFYLRTGFTRSILKRLVTNTSRSN